MEVPANDPSLVGLLDGLSRSKKEVLGADTLSDALHEVE